jgi:hypothetical protein
MSVADVPLLSPLFDSLVYLAAVAAAVVALFFPGLVVWLTLLFSFPPTPFCLNSLMRWDTITRTATSVPFLASLCVSCLLFLSLSLSRT